MLWEEIGIDSRSNNDQIVLTNRDGTYTEYKNRYGLKHRIDGPALIKGNIHHWFNNGLRHRSDGPAVYTDGDPSSPMFWYFDGTNVTEILKKWAKEFDVNIKTPSEQDKQMVAL